MEFNCKKEKAALYSLTSDGKITKHIDKVSISNGLVWSADNKTFYFIDTLTNSVAAYDFDAKT